MKKSKLIRYLSTLNHKEWSEFKEFCRSPYFNKDSDSLLLLDVLDNCFPGFAEQKVHKDLLSKLAFKSKSNPTKRLSYAASKLSALFENYLSVKESQDDKAVADFSLLSEFHQKELHMDFEKMLTDMLAPKNDILWKPTDEFNQYKLKELADMHFLQHTRSRKYLYLGAESMQHLDNYYRIQKIRFVCALWSRQNILQGKYDLRLPDNFIEHQGSNSDVSNQVFEMFVLVYKMLSDGGNEIHFKKLLQHFRNNISGIDSEIQKEVSTYLLNYCTQKINTGNAAYFEILFELYELGLNSKFLLDNGYIRPALFKNIVSVAVRLGKFDWAQNFVKEYELNLESQHRDSAVAYNKATLYFEQGNYKQTLFILTTTPFSDPFYALGARSMLVRIFYETNEFDALQAQIQSFSIYLRRNKSISAYQKTIHMSLLRYIRKLTSLTANDQQSLKRLSVQIASNKQVAYSQWILEMTDKRIVKHSSGAK